MKNQPFLSRIRQGILAFVGMVYVKLIYYTCRWQYQNHQVLDPYIGKKPFILCFWHARLLMIPYTWRFPYPFHMLISGHRDGQLIARIIQYFNISTVHGSSSKGGAEAIRILLRSLHNRITIGITPDGPRGPRQQVKPGIYALSKIGNVDVIPVTYATSRRKIFNTWDNFYLPLPFGKGIFMWGNPISSPKDQSQEEWLKMIEYQLNQLGKDADNTINGQ